MGYSMSLHLKKDAPADLIESIINFKDDGVEKIKGADKPLRITARGPKENLLEFGLPDAEEPSWCLNQKPGASPGLNFSDAMESSKFFIDNSFGNIGINNDSPEARLHIRHTAGQPALRVEAMGEESNLVIIDKDSNLGIGLDSPTARLHIKGMNQPALKIDVGQENTTALVIDKDGYIGMGEASPSAHLHVRHTDPVKPALEIEIENQSHIPMVIDSKGFVGIGLTKGTAPRAHLEVGGNFSLSSGPFINSICNDGDLTDNGENAIPTVQAVKAYVAKQLTATKKTFKLSDYVYNTGWLNDFDRVLDYQLPSDYVMVGFHSYHDNGKEDRRFDFYYRRIEWE